jgi:hypothetical protein
MKRIVFLHPDGIYQILGVAPPELLPTVIAADNSVIETRGRVIPFASLVQVKERYAVYKEPLTPTSATFTKDARQV